MPKLFQPGYDPRRNVGGRPRRRDVIDAMLAELKRKPEGQRQTNAILLAQTAVREALGGDVSWAKLLMEYVYGKPVQPLTLDIPAEVERLAAERGLDPRKVISIYERLAS